MGVLYTPTIERPSLCCPSSDATYRKAFLLQNGSDFSWLVALHLYFAPRNSPATATLFFQCAGKLLQLCPRKIIRKTRDHYHGFSSAVRCLAPQD